MQHLLLGNSMLVQQECIAHICIPQCRSLTNTHHQAFNECLREFCFRSMDQTLPHMHTYTQPPRTRKLDKAKCRTAFQYWIPGSLEERCSEKQDKWSSPQLPPAVSKMAQGGGKRDFGSPGKTMLPALTEQRTRGTGVTYKEHPRNV